ncbi:MAG: amidohydrolase family protein [Thermodesulfobacteriota bacterium]
MSRILLTASTILPISSPPIKDGALLIADGKIKEIGLKTMLAKRFPLITNVELGRGILLPGFVNAHTHLELGWIKRRIGRFNGFIGWLEQIIRAKKIDTNREEIEKSTRNGIKSLIVNGVTTVGEVSSFGGIDKPILKKSGLRTVLFVELFDRDQDFLKSLTFEQEELFEERPFPHAPYSCSPNFLKKLRRFQSKTEIPSGIHLAESQDEVKFLRGYKNGFEQQIFPLIGKDNFHRIKAKSPFQYLKKLKSFHKTKVTTVHMVQVHPAEIEEIKKREIGVVLCPRSNYFLKVGVPPIKHYSELHRIGIGTDGLSSNFNFDFFEELRFFYLIANHVAVSDAPFFTVYAATLGGAKSIFLEHKTGSIEKGKDADLIFLDPADYYTDPYLSVISSTSKDLKLSMVRGKVIYSKKKVWKTI